MPDTRWLSDLQSLIFFVWQALGPSLTVAFVLLFGYATAYGLYLQRHAMRDIRNPGGALGMQRMINTLFWEKLYDRDLFAILYASCFPLFFTLVLLLIYRWS